MKALIIGAARSGIAVSKLLHQHGYEIYITDQHEILQKQELEKMQIHLYDHGHPEMLKDISWDIIVKNPGIPYHNPFIKYFVDQGYFINTEIEIAYQFAKQFQYGAITGTNGKTTITTLLYKMLAMQSEAKFAGNIGVPLSEVVLGNEHKKLNVALELSNFQLLGTKTFHPHVSVVVNLAPDHLDYMDDLESYYRSKMKIYESCNQEDYFLRNIDDENIMKYATNIPCQIIDFSLHKKADLYRANKAVYFKNILLFYETDVKLVGEYNIGNMMIASCMAYIMGISVENIQKTLKTFQGVEHRLEYVGTNHDIDFYNDSKATNTHATSAALQAFQKPIILLAGGHDKGISFDELQKYDRKVKYCIAFGETKHQLASVFTHTIEVETMKDAFDEAMKLAKAGDVVLLSPACASYDQFKNYEVRGNTFKEYVHQYIENKKR